MTRLRLVIERALKESGLAAKNLEIEITENTLMINSAANLDMLQHYRPEYNIVRRPTQDSGRGYALTGHHEIMLPLLYAMLVEAFESAEKGTR